MDNESQLKVHEWLAIVTLIGIMIIIVGISFLEGLKTRSYSHPNFKMSTGCFDVLIKGAVDFPGIYHIPSPMAMKEILELSGIKEEADLSRYALEGLVKKGRTITVPYRKMITVYVEDGSHGEKNSVSMPKGSKVSDLLNVLKLPDDADLQVLQKKRLLKDGETIELFQN